MVVFNKVEPNVVVVVANFLPYANRKVLHVAKLFSELVLMLIIVKWYVS